MPLRDGVSQAMPYATEQKLIIDRSRADILVGRWYLVRLLARCRQLNALLRCLVACERTEVESLSALEASYRTSDHGLVSLLASSDVVACARFALMGCQRLSASSKRSVMKKYQTDSRPNGSQRLDVFSDDASPYDDKMMASLNQHLGSRS